MGHLVSSSCPPARKQEIADTKVSKGGIAIVALASAPFLLVLDCSVITVWISSLAHDDPAWIGELDSA